MLASLVARTGFINELTGRTAFAARESIDFTVIAPMPQNYPILAASCAQVALEMPKYVAIRSINDFNEWVPDCNPANPKITGGKANANQSPKGSKGTPTPDIDFDRYTLLVADAGSKPSSGF